MKGLSEKELDTIKNVFGQFPSINQVRLFGSRALGTNKPGSDIDLVIMNRDVSLPELRKINSLFEESSLPVRVDLLLYHETEAAVREHIDRFGINMVI